MNSNDVKVVMKVDQMVAQKDAKWVVVMVAALIVHLASNLVDLTVDCSVESLDSHLAVVMVVMTVVLLAELTDDLKAVEKVDVMVGLLDDQ